MKRPEVPSMSVSPSDDLIVLLAKLEFARGDLEAVASPNQQTLALKTLANMVDRLAARAELYQITLPEDLMIESAGILADIQQFEQRFRGSGMFAILGISRGASEERRQAFEQLSNRALTLMGRFGTLFEGCFDGRAASRDWANTWKTFLDDLRRTLVPFVV